MELDFNTTSTLTITLLLQAKNMNLWEGFHTDASEKNTGIQHALSIPLQLSACVRQSIHHVYKTLWTPFMGEILVAKQECGNPEDAFVVAVEQRSSSSGEVVSHLPRGFSHVLQHFITPGGTSACKVTGRQQQSPLIQGGIEVSCMCSFLGKKFTERAKELFKKA